MNVEKLMLDLVYGGHAGWAALARLELRKRLPGAAMIIRRPPPILIDKQRGPVRGTM
jgi:hypothetical protein